MNVQTIATPGAAAHPQDFRQGAREQARMASLLGMLPPRLFYSASIIEHKKNKK